MIYLYGSLHCGPCKKARLILKDITYTNATHEMVPKMRAFARKSRMLRLPIIIRATDENWEIYKGPIKKEELLKWTITD